MFPSPPNVIRRNIVRKQLREPLMNPRIDRGGREIPFLPIDRSAAGGGGGGGGRVGRD